MTHWFCSRCSRLLSEREILVVPKEDGSCEVECATCEAGVIEAGD